MVAARMEQSFDSTAKRAPQMRGGARLSIPPVRSGAIDDADTPLHPAPAREDT